MSDRRTLGTFERFGDALEVRFERVYPRSVETVWSALTEPERLKDWMGASRVEPFVGGGIEMMTDGAHPMTGRILVWDPPHILEFTWSNVDAPNSVIRYELIREGAGARVIFTHKAMPYRSSGLMLPGWHVIFARLASQLANEPMSGAAPTWRQMQRIYVEHYDLRGVALEIEESMKGAAP